MKIYNKIRRLRQKVQKFGKKGYDDVIPQLKKELYKWKKKLKRISVYDTYDDDFKRIKYCRYADDFLIGITGTKVDAKKVKEKTAKFLKENLDLDLSMQKTKITYSSEQVNFLSYLIGCSYRKEDNESKTTGKIRFHVPKDVIRERIKEFTQDGKPVCLPELVILEDYEILLKYDAKLRGWYNYWKMAENVSSFLNKVYYYARESLMKTLANKYKSTKSKMYKKYYDKKKKQVKVKVESRNKIYKMISKFRQDIKPRTNVEIDSLQNIYYFTNGKEIKDRIRGSKCELCGRKTDNLIPHHIRRMADIRSDDEMSEWKRVMIGKYRKSLMVCKTCHNRIHRTTR